jgi:hypothetical protein
MPLTRRRVIATAGTSLAAMLFLNIRSARSQPLSSDPLAWLQERVSIEEAERRFMPMPDDRTNYVPELRKPFGFLNAQWEKLKALVQTGDEIWTVRLHAKQRQTCTISSFFRRVPLRLGLEPPQCGQRSGRLAVCGTRAIRGVVAGI